MSKPRSTAYAIPVRIAAPTPDDNFSLWVPSFNKKHYQQMLFGRTGRSLHTYYLEQSSGRYTANVALQATQVVLVWPIAALATYVALVLSRVDEIR